MKKLLLIIPTILATFAFADSKSDMQALKQEANATHQGILQKKVAIESESHKGRTDILQKADECIKNAKTREQYKECEQQEQAARQSLREKTKSENQALKQTAEQKKEEFKSRREKIKHERLTERNISK